MNKEEMILEIKNIIAERGELDFNGHLNTEIYPTLPHKSNLVFYVVGIDNLFQLNIEVHKNEVDDPIDYYSIPMTDADTDTLERVLKLAQKWDEICKSEEE